MPEDLEIRVRGRTFTGWKEAEVARGIEHVAGGFSIRVRDTGPRAAVPGQPVEIRYGRDRLLKGFVDRRRGRLSETDGKIDGRDATEELVDNSGGLEESPNVAGEIDERYEFFNIGLEDLVKRLCNPFGIPVQVQDTDLGERFQKFSIEPGEKAWASIERGCRQRAVLAFSDGDGQLILARPGQRHTIQDLIEGENILDAEYEFSDADRHSIYIVKGQRRGTDEDFGALVASVEGRASDTEVGRFRPLVVLAEGMATSSSAELRAQWHSTVQAARSNQLEITVRGFREFPNNPTSDLWIPNRIVRARIPRWSIDSDFLISAVRYRMSEKAGLRSTLRLVRPDAYTPKDELVLDDGFRGFLKEWDQFSSGSVPAAVLGEEDE